MQLPHEHQLEIGCDEVGRGCIFGNVVAAAVILPNVANFPDDTWKQIRDSKKLTAKKRDSLALWIKQHAIAWAVGEATPQEIDQHNILQATMMAMHRAIDIVTAGKQVHKLLIDGSYFRPYPNIPYELFVGGDDKVLSIAAASILAKTHRDHGILKLIEQQPEFEKYGLKTNMGYGTAKHCDAIKVLGRTEYHRKSFHIKSIDGAI